MTDSDSDFGDTEHEYADLELIEEGKKADFEEYNTSRLLEELKSALRGETDLDPKAERIRADLLAREYISRDSQGDIADQSEKVAKYSLWGELADIGPQGKDAVFEAILKQSGIEPELGPEQSRDDVIRDTAPVDKYPRDEEASTAYMHTVLENHFRNTARRRGRFKKEEREEEEGQRWTRREVPTDPKPPEDKEEETHPHLDQIPSESSRPWTPPASPQSDREEERAHKRITVDRAVRGARLIAEVEEEELSETAESKRAMMGLAVKALVEEFEEDLGKYNNDGKLSSEDAINKAEVVKNVHLYDLYRGERKFSPLSQSDKTDLYNEYHEDLKNRLPKAHWPDRDSLTNWSLDVKNNLLDIVSQNARGDSTHVEELVRLVLS